MLCEEFERRSQRLLDSRQFPEEDEQLQLHASECEACRQDLAVQERLFSGLRMLDTPPMRHDFSEHVVAQVVASRPTLPISTTHRIGTHLIGTRRLMICMLAASLLIAVLPAIWTGLAARRGETPTRTVAMVTAPTYTGLSSTTVGAVPAASATPATTVSPPVVSSDETTSAADAAAMEHLSLLDELRDNLSHVSMERLESVDQIAEGFRPIATSLQTALNVLRRSLPVAKEQRTPKTAPDTSRVLDLLWIA